MGLFFVCLFSFSLSTRRKCGDCGKNNGWNECKQLEDEAVRCMHLKISDFFKKAWIEDKFLGAIMKVVLSREK